MSGGRQAHDYNKPVNPPITTSGVYRVFRVDHVLVLMLDARGVQRDPHSLAPSTRDDPHAGEVGQHMHPAAV